MLVVVQFNTVVAGGVMLTVGSVLSCVMPILAVAVQPFAAVPVTVYVPAVETLVLAVVTPVLHE